MLDVMRQNAGSWIIKVLFAIIIGAFIFAYGSGSLGGGGGGVLAYVNDSPILISDFKEQYEYEVRTLQQRMPNLSSDDIKRLQVKQATLAKMVNSALVEHEARKLGLDVSDAELRMLIQSNPQFWGSSKRFDEQYYRNSVRAMGMTPGMYESQSRKVILQDKLAGYVGRTALIDEKEARDVFNFAQERIRVEYAMFPWSEFQDAVRPTQTEIETYYADNQDRFKRPATASFDLLVFTPQSLASMQTVTDEEAKAYYEANKAEFDAPESVHARHILIKLDENAPDAEVQKAKTRLLKIRARIAKGKDFADVAKTSSEGPSNVRGGDLGWFTRDAMVAPFAEAAFAMKPGEVSQPVRTKFGWHLIKVEERREAGLKPYGEAHDAIVTQLAEDKAADAMNDLLDEAIGRVIAGDALKDVGETLGMQVQQLPPVPKAVLVQQLGISQQDVDMMYLLEDGKASDVAIGLEQGYMLAAKTGSVAESVTPLEDVKDAIVQALKREGAMKLAKEKAEVELAGLTDAVKAETALAAVKDRLKTTEPFLRSGMAGELGMNPTLVESAFGAKQGEWLSGPFAVGEGFALVRLKERIEPTEGEWEAQKATLLFQLTRSRQEEMFMGYLGSLRASAEIKVKESSLLD